MDQQDDYLSEEDEDYTPEAGTRKKAQKKSVFQVCQRGALVEHTVAGGRSQGQSAEQTDPLAELKVKTKKAKVDAVWAQLNAPRKEVKGKVTGSPVVSDSKQAARCKGVPEWMVSLGLAKSTSTSEAASGPSSSAGGIDGKAVKAEGCPEQKENEASKLREEAKAIAAAAIAAARAAQVGTDLEGRPQVTEVRDFAGEKEEVTRIVDPKAPVKRKEQPASGLDALIQQIEKKKKINVLDKSRKDWGEYKEEQGVTEQLEDYKKSNDKYLDKVAFLQRAEVREYEVERDQKLAAARKKPPG